MEDRFKMRAWDENNKIMHHDFQFIKSGDDGNDWIIFQSDEQKLDFDKEKNFCINVYPNPYFAQQLKIMQCTGLKDKNGKLIYEGDILFYKIGSIKCREVVKWSPERCGWIKGYQDLSTYKKYHEVLGNIYENPELIKDFKNE